MSDVLGISDSEGTGVYYFYWFQLEMAAAPPSVEEALRTTVDAMKVFVNNYSTRVNGSIYDTVTSDSIDEIYARILPLARELEHNTRYPTGDLLRIFVDRVVNLYDPISYKRIFATVIATRTVTILNDPREAHNLTYSIAEAIGSIEGIDVTVRESPLRSEDGIPSR